MSDSAYIILTSVSKSTTGNFFIDDEVLASVGITNLCKYKFDPSIAEKDLAPDFFLYLKNFEEERKENKKSRDKNYL